MNRPALLGIDRSQFIHWFADYVQNATQCFFAHRHHDRTVLVDHLHPADHAFSGLHGDAAYAALSNVLLHFEDDINLVRYIEAFAYHPQGFVNRRHGGFFELHVDCGSGNLDDPAMFSLGAPVFCALAFS